MRGWPAIRGSFRSRYRTRFFLNQIAISKWTLATPLNVHGVPINAKNFEHPVAAPSSTAPAKSNRSRNNPLISSILQPPQVLETVGKLAAKGVEQSKRIEAVICDAVRDKLRVTGFSPEDEATDG